MQDSVAKTISIIKDFIFEARIEKAILIANLVLLFVTGSKISLPQLSIAISHGKHKSKSFNIESTHITQYNRLSALFMLMAIAYRYCCKLGYIVNNIKPITIKLLKRLNGNTETKPQLTIFKYGFYLLKNFFDNLLCDRAVVTRQLYQILNYPPNTKIPEDSKIYKIIMKVT